MVNVNVSVSQPSDDPLKMIIGFRQVPRAGDIIDTMAIMGKIRVTDVIWDAYGEPHLICVKIEDEKGS